MPKATFAPMLQTAVAFIKVAVQKPDAFEDENMITTENSLGALAKLCYAHMDGSVLTEGDLISVLNRMPFTSDENESMTSHRILFDQIENPASVINANAGAKKAASEAVQRIRQHVIEQGPQPEERILDFANTQRLDTLKC